ncbi:SafA/ExsA family spore coat assembly protein [Virgibacillus sp. W0430]|uniref:SafA/ExsA family spore coat assembly protein n=1 Tax=Virgibacillus sp. W0430 TaxID=3391580 RepID=UPI003F44A1BC
MKIHIVQKGDTLWEIAKQYGVAFEELKQMNAQVASPDMIMPGMKVKIPSSAKQVKKQMGKEQAIKQTENIEVKPKPQIKEDDNEKPKDIQLKMPMYHMPVYPIHPLPVMDQELYQTKTFDYPKAPEPLKPKENKKEMAKEQSINKTEAKKEQDTYLHDQMKVPSSCNQMPMMPMCCHYIHPCCTPMHFNHMPMQPMQMPANYMQYGGQPPSCPHGMMDGSSEMQHPISAYPHTGLSMENQQMNFGQMPMTNMHPNDHMGEGYTMNMHHHSTEPYPPNRQLRSNPTPPNLHGSSHTGYEKSDEGKK